MLKETSDSLRIEERFCQILMGEIMPQSVHKFDTVILKDSLCLKITVNGNI